MKQQQNSKMGKQINADQCHYLKYTQIQNNEVKLKQIKKIACRDFEI